MDSITIENQLNRVEISLFGGHVLSWRHKGRSILWLSELADLSGASAIRGGIPICFPWFAEQGTPKHGFARTQRWQLSHHDDSSATLTLSDNGETKTIWPHRFALALTVSLADNQLVVTLDIHNRDDHSWQFSGALHSYFSCDNASDVSVAALHGRPYFDSLQQGCERHFQSDRLPNPIDAIVPHLSELKVDTDSSLNLVHTGSDSCVIWNPAESHPSDVSRQQSQQFICFEAAIAMVPITLESGCSHRLTQTVTV